MESESSDESMNDIISSKNKNNKEKYKRNVIKKARVEGTSYVNHAGNIYFVLFTD